MELIVFVISLAVLAFGGSVFTKLDGSPTVAFINAAPARFGFGKIIAISTIAVIIIAKLFS